MSPSTTTATETAATTHSIGDELANIDLGDKRLNRRVQSVLENLAANPTANLPNAQKGRHELVAAYRLFDNENVTWEKLMRPHWVCAEQRAKLHPVVLALQDTTELNYNGQQISGLGPLSYPTQRGMYLHATLMITPDRISLGVADAWMYARELSAEQAAKLPPARVTKKSEQRKANAEKKRPKPNNEAALPPPLPRLVSTKPSRFPRPWTHQHQTCRHARKACAGLKAMIESQTWHPSWEKVRAWSMLRIARGTFWD